MLRIFSLLLFINTCTVFSADTLATQVRDSSILRVIPLPSHGKAGEKPFLTINKTNLPYINYAVSDEIVSAVLPGISLNTGTLGEFNSLSVFGAMPNQISTYFNGRNSGNYFLQSGSLNYFSPENFENLEIFSGSDATIFSDNASGILINRQEIIYNTKEPYTKLQYVQSGSEFLSLDGIFAHNLSDKINFNFGFRSQSGSRDLVHSEYSSWNVRGGLRYNHDSTFNISLTENFTNHKINHNGGTITSDQNNDSYNEITASTLFTKAKEQVFHHDLTASFTKVFAQETPKELSGNLYFSHSNFENRTDTNLILPIGAIDSNYTFSDYFVGGNLQYNSQLSDFFKYRFGGDFSYFDTEKSLLFSGNSGSKLSAFARLELALIKNTALSVGARLTNFASEQYISGGGKFKYSLKNDSANYINAFIDYSFSNTIPNIFILPFSFKKETQIPIIASLEYSTNNYLLTMTGFYRTIENPITAENISLDRNKIQIQYTQSDNAKVYGGTISLGFPLFSRFYVSLKNTSQFCSYSGTEAKVFPSYFITADVNYSQTIGRSAFKVGLNCSFFAKYNNLQYIPFYDSYISSDFNSKSNYDGLNLYGIARLGSAFIKVSLNNILDSKFSYLANYPMQGRVIRLSVHWDFFN